MFSVSTRTQYGIRALVQLAQAGEEGLPVSEIALREGISPKYLEGIVSLLKAAGLVLSQRGKNGGYRLSRDSALIPMLEVITALDGKVEPVQCAGGSGCSKAACCLPSRFWSGLKSRIDGYLTETSLADILSGR